MSEIWDFFKKWFQDAEESSPQQPYLHELIERTAEELAAYQRWKESLPKKRMLNWLHEQYVQYLINHQHTDDAIDFLDNPSDKGFVIHFNQTQYPFAEITHLFDFLKEQVLALGYRSYMSDTKTYQRSQYIETINRHYLKPSPSHLIRQGNPDGEKLNQRFGNITIDMLLRNDVVQHLKLRATSYRDHQFARADEFGDLMQALVDQG